MLDDFISVAESTSSHWTKVLKHEEEMISKIQHGWEVLNIE